MKENARKRPSASDIKEVLNIWTKNDYYMNVLEEAVIKSDNFKAQHPTNSCENSKIKYSSINSDTLF
ncbi:25499_t:CDS:1, partial [Gigaspora rosea]